MASPTFLRILLLSLVLPLAAIILNALICGLQSPHKNTPGPWHTQFSGIVGFYHSLTGGMLRWTRSLHEQYGPIVRIAPKEVSVSSVESFHKVHGKESGFTKGPAFDKFKVGPVHSVFTMRNPTLHAQRRRIMMRGFTLASLRKNWAHRIHHHACLAVSQIKFQAEVGVADVYHWWRLYAADVIAEMAFGRSFGMLATGKKTDYYIALQDTSLNLLLQVVVPFLSHLSWAPIRRVRQVAGANKIIYDQGSKAVDNLSKSDGQSIFADILQAVEKDESGLLDDDAIRTEAALMLIGGSDTTAVTLTYAVWAVLSNGAVQSRLEAEVAALPQNFRAEDLENLKVLNNVIDETLRLYSPGAGKTTRLVPPDGATLEGYHIAKGTYVTTIPWHIFRDESIFPDAERFDETRFERLTKEQKDAFMPFHIGSRSCIGMQLARMEIRFALAILFRECKGLKLGSSMNEDMMQQYPAFLISPRSGKCEVTL